MGVIRPSVSMGQSFNLPIFTSANSLWSAFDMLLVLRCVRYADGDGGGDGESEALDGSDGGASGNGDNGDEVVSAVTVKGLMMIEGRPRIALLLDSCLVGRGTLSDVLRDSLSTK